jgi:hypothetical protein
VEQSVSGSAHCDEWVAEKETDVAWQEAVRVSRHEFETTLVCLAAGKSSPTFPKLFASKTHNDALEKSFEKHRNERTISAEAYLRRRHFALKNALDKRTLIYLDTNHWVNMTNVLVRSAKATKEYARLLAHLDKLAQNDRILCPLSFPLFLEMMKQTDERTRLATIHLMEAFSGGVCLQYPLEIEKVEIRQRLLRVVLGKDAPDLHEWFFTKVGYLAGERLPFNKAYSNEDNWFIQKVSINGAWTMPLEHIAEERRAHLLQLLAESRMAEATTIDAAWYQSRKTSFREALQREKTYAVYLMREDMERIADEVANEFAPHRDVSRLPGGMNTPDPWALPSVQILAGVNAALLTSKKSFDVNDIIDFRHAAISIPYCNALFCDKRMAHVLSCKPLSFGKLYDTVILWKPSDILQYLSTL